MGSLWIPLLVGLTIMFLLIGSFAIQGNASDLPDKLRCGPPTPPTDWLSGVTSTLDTIGKFLLTSCGPLWFQILLGAILIGIILTKFKIPIIGTDS